MSNDLNLLVRKIRAHARDALLPLYREHAEFLARAVKTAGESCRDALLEDFDRLVKYATCHEVAINQNSALEMNTHEHRFGCEHEFMTHPKSKFAGRDLACRIIWFFLREILDGPAWENLVEYDFYELSVLVIHCPLCDEEIARGESEEGNLHYSDCLCLTLDDRGYLSDDFCETYCDKELVDHLFDRFGVEVEGVGEYYVFRTFLPEKYADLLRDNARLNCDRARARGW